MVSKSNLVFLILIIFSLILLTSARLKHRKSKSFLQTETQEQLQEKAEEAKQAIEDKKLDELMKTTQADEWDNHSLAEMDLAHFMTQISDTNPDYLSSPVKEAQKPVIQDNASIWKLTSAEKTEEPFYF